MKKFTIEEIRDLLNQFYHEKIGFSRMVEILNEMVSEKMGETNEPQYKDGDFVVNECGVIIIFKNKVGNSIYDHAYFSESAWVVVCSDAPTATPIKGYATEEEKKKILNELAKEGKRWNEDKKCIEDIPVPKFESGEKVQIKENISSKTHYNVGPGFVEDMDDLIGKTMIVDKYLDGDNYVACEETEYAFLEEWLEPYEELKEGDLAIFWDKDQSQSRIGVYNQFRNDVFYPHVDHIGNRFKNAVKFESKEQFERLIKSEI